MIETTLPSANDSPSEQVSTKIVTAIADLKNVDPTDLPPLYQAFDPDALDRLFDPHSTGSTLISGRVSFTIAGCDVVVDSAEQVTVTPSDSSTASERR